MAFPSMVPVVQSTDLCGEFARLLSSVDLERRFYQTIIASFPLPVLLVDPDLTIGMANAPFRILTDLGNQNLFGRPIKDVLHDNALGQAIVRLLEQPQPATETLSYLPAAGTSSGYRLRLLPLHGFEPDGAVRFLVFAEPLEAAIGPTSSWPVGETAEIMEEALHAISYHSEMISSALPMSHPLQQHLIEMQVAIGKIAFLRNNPEARHMSGPPRG